MTREEMVKRHWKPYMIISYKDEGMKLAADCLLCAIDFDAEILTITPVDNFYEQREFQANLKFCSIPKRMKVISINGKKLKDLLIEFIDGDYLHTLKSRSEQLGWIKDYIQSKANPQT